MEPPKNDIQTEEDDTVALHKKRARRVSFADNEITSVHVFRRDSSSSSSDPSTLGFFRDLAGDSDDDNTNRTNSFLRPIGSPSSGGSSTADDADRDEEGDDFHGPVSACFIRPDRFSDSGASDDATMDSTAFSLHYRSLAQSDSGDLKTRQSGLTPSPQGSFMDLTEPERLGEEHAAEVESCGRDSNDMSIEGEHEYCRVSPVLDAILAAGSKDSSPILPECQYNLGGSVASQVEQVHHVQASDSSIKELKECAKDAAGPICRRLDFANANRGTPLKVDEDRFTVSDSNHKSDQENQNPIQGFTPLSFSSSKQLFMSYPNSCRYTGNITPPLVNKSILKLRTNETTPIMSTLKETNDKLKSRLSKYLPKYSLETSLSNKDHEYKQVESHKSPLEEKLFSLTPENNTCQGLIDKDDQGIQSFRNTSQPSQNEETVGSKMDEENIKLTPAYSSSNFKIPISVNSGLGQAIESNSEPVGTKLEFSDLGNNKQPNSPLDIGQVNEFAQVTLSASKITSAECPSSRIPVLSTPPTQEVTTQFHSLHHPPGIGDLSPKGKSDGPGLDKSYNPVLQVDQCPLTKSGSEVASRKKRKGFEILSNGDNMDKIGRIDESPEVLKSGNGDLQLNLKQTSYMRSEREKLDLIVKKFLDSTNQLLSPLVDKLNLRLIDRLEDILGHLQKVKTVEILCSEIHSQHKITNPLNIPGDKRVVETRMLLYNIAYEKAKLQLMHMKRDRLKKKVQQLSFGLQESEVIKLNFLPSSSESGVMDTQANDSHIHTSTTLSSSQGKCQVSCGKVREMRQELETLDSKAKPISEFLYRYCKMGGDQSYANTMKVASDYVQKRMLCKSLFQNLKFWDIEDFERKDGYYRVVLNYRDYITQMVTVNTELPSIIISNKLNDVNIVKTFPNLDVLTAFMFVLNPHTTKECTGSISMVRVTQVQSAQIKIGNLVEAKFYLHSVQRLELMLSFIDFYGGRKVKVTLDMACLQCGAYPAEVLPSQIYDNSWGEQKSLPSSLLEEIRTAAERTKIGYSRIDRLCRCISQAIQACNPRA